LERRLVLSTVSLGADRDNTLFESFSGSLSNGAGAYLFAGLTDRNAIRRGILSFDIAASVPEGATIDSVELSLHMSRTISGAQTIGLHAVSADWGEGTSNAPGQEGKGTTAALGDVTWIHRFANSSTWTTPGGDFAPTSSATASVAGVAHYQWGSTADMVADVQGWLDEPSSNFGWILVGNEAVVGGAKRFDTKENSNVAFRPVLTVDFTETPNVSIGDVAVTEGNTGTVDAVFPVTLSAASSQTVTVDYATLDGSAVAGEDYQAQSGTLTFQPGETTQTITVAVIGDTPDETNEAFFVNLSAATNANIDDGQGEATINDDDQAAVVGRHVFYNNSAFDGNDPAPGSPDDSAIAADKTALRPGGTASFDNYTSFSLGINGVMVDVASSAATPTAADFLFRVGNDGDPAGWETVSTPVTLAVREGAGVDGSDRVTLTWPDHNIRRQWLQVTVLAERLGLAADDVFYFGNAVGEAGNSASNTRVTTTDLLLARNNPRNFLNPATIDTDFDYSRDKRVNATDVLLARNNQTNFLTELQLLDFSGEQLAKERTPAEVSQPTASDPSQTYGS